MTDLPLSEPMPLTEADLQVVVRAVLERVVEMLPRPELGEVTAVSGARASVALDADPSVTVYAQTLITVGVGQRVALLLFPPNGYYVGWELS